MARRIPVDLWTSGVGIRDQSNRCGTRIGAQIRDHVTPVFTIRATFANVLDDPQLIAVTASSNRAKGDQDLPSNTAYGCTYSRMWVAVKARWRLTLQQAEKDALTRVLSEC